MLRPSIFSSQVKVRGSLVSLLIRVNQSRISSSLKTSARLFFALLWAILANFSERAAPTRWVGESGVINSGNCCSRVMSSFFRESRTDSSISDWSSVKY